MVGKSRLCKLLVLRYFCSVRIKPDYRLIALGTLNELPILISPAQVALKLFVIH